MIKIYCFRRNEPLIYMRVKCVHAHVARVIVNALRATIISIYTMHKHFSIKQSRGNNINILLR